MTDTYVIMNDVDVTQAHVDASKEDSLCTHRKSLNGALAVLKYEGTQPSVFSGLTEYSYAQILVEMSKVAWQSVE